LCSDTGAAKLGLGLGEPHLGIFDPKFRKFNGNVSDRGGNGGLGSQSGDDGGIDLCLKGGGVRHPERNKNCGLELEQATTGVEIATVAGVKLYNNTGTQHKANDDLNDTKTCRIFVKCYENEEYFAAKQRN
jgi:hypothetical protein